MRRCARVALLTFGIACFFHLAMGCRQQQPLPYEQSSPAPADAAWTAPPAAVAGSATPLPGHSFQQLGDGFAADNPPQGLHFELDSTGVRARASSETWTWHYRLDSIGRQGVSTSLLETFPVLSEAGRVEYHRGPVVEWYVNTFQGLEQGFDVGARPAGQGPLVLSGLVATDLSPAIRDDGDTVAFERDGAARFTVAGARAWDATGRPLPAELRWAADALRVEVDDSDATYPVFIDPNLGTCPAAWCSDGDKSTIDICNKGGKSCSHVFDPTFEGVGCIWGEYCCDDGEYHLDCDDPALPVGQECHDYWCNDGDPGTIDVCDQHVVKTDTHVCTHTFNTDREGTPCMFGTFCCGDGLYHADCSGIPALGPCPSSWCKDGDKSTIDTCFDYNKKTGKSKCSHSFNPKYEGKPCVFGDYCCEDGLFHVDCSLTPAISFSSPTDAEVMNVANTDCEDGATGCTLDVRCTTVYVDDGSAAALAVDCGSGETSTAGTVTGDAVTFAGTVLPDGSTCSLTCTATDLSSGDLATAGPITVTVDRTPPTVVNLVSNDLILTSIHDVDADAEGLQYFHRIDVGGLEAGRDAVLEIDTGKKQFFEAITLTEPAPATPKSTLIYSLRSYGSSGTLTFSATVTDAAGNVATDVDVVDIVITEPLIRIGLPLFVDPAACDVAPCANGFCVPDVDHCGIALDALSNGSLRVFADNILFEADNIRICSDHPNVTSGDKCKASGSGFRQVALATLDALSPSVDVDVAGLIPEGAQTLRAEGRIGSNKWASSADSFDNTQERLVFSDTIAPAVTSFDATSDFDASGCHSALEGGTAGSFAVVCTDSGTSTLTVNGAIVAIQSTTAGVPVSFDGVALLDGSNDLQATCSDDVGNSSAPSSLVLLVDGIPPQLDLLGPQGPVVLAGDDLDARYASDESGATVTLVSSLAPAVSHQTVVPPTGIAIFDHATFGVLSDGTHQLTASVSDACGNATSNVSGAIQVDTLPPTVGLDAPGSGVTLGDIDDASTDPGYQVSARFSTTGDAATWDLLLSTGCSATFQGCSPAALVTSGVITNAGGAEPPELLVIQLGVDPEHFIVTVTVRDAAGNEVSESANVSVDPATCVLSLVGLPTDGKVSNAACPVPNSDCASVDLSFQGKLVGACGSVTDIRLLADSATADTQPVSGGAASFSQSLADGGSVTFQVEGLSSGTAVVASGSLLVRADLEAPVALFAAEDIAGFTTPASGAQPSFNAADDQSSAGGLQVHLHAEVTDVGFGGGSIDDLVCDGVTVEAGLPLEFVGDSLSADLLAVTLAETRAAIDCVLSVSDDFGNTSTTSFSYTADATSPDALTLVLADSNRRRPTVVLDVTSVGDDGSAGGAATAYDYRYSRVPITQGTFFSSCDASQLLTATAYPTPLPPGQTQSYAITGPDARTGIDLDCVLVMHGDATTPWFFAARVVDDAGNYSPLDPSSVLEVTGLGLRAAAFTAATTAGTNDVQFDRRARAVGDIDNDGFDDFAVGGHTSAGFCIFFGSDEDTVTGQIVNADTSGTGSTHQCIMDSTATRGGSNIVNLGDTNGDGLGDLGTAWGAKDGSGPTQPQVRIHGGVTAGNTLDVTPILVITGHTDPSLQVSFDGGDFTGDGLADIAVGSRRDVVGTTGVNLGRVWVIPGSTSWPAATVDLSDASSRAAFHVASFVMTGVATPPLFGAQVEFVGDLFEDADATREELAISAWFPLGTSSMHQVVVLRGRPETGGAIETGVSLNHTGMHGPGEPEPSEDARSALLKPEPNAHTVFGNGLSSADLNGDGVPEVLVQHATSKHSSANATFYLFDGLAVRSAEGGSVTIHGGQTPTPVGDLAFVGPSGATINGPFSGLALLGNLNDDPAGLPAIGYRDFSPDLGGAFVRLNLENVGASIPRGSFPFVDLALDDPFSGSNPSFGYFNVDGIGDFNGDGRADFVVSTNGSGYSVLFY